MGDVNDDFRVWMNRQPAGPGQLGFIGAVIKPGPNVVKTVTVADFGDRATGEVSKRQLTVRTFPRLADSPGYDFNNPTRSWSCENEEVVRLLAFLGTDVSGSGRYRVVDTQSPAAALLDLASDVGLEQLAKALTARTDVAALVAELASTGPGLRAAESVVIAQRRKLVQRLQTLAQDPATTETEMQRVMGNAYWLFGGRYVGVADRRNLVPLDQHDIPLLGADGTLHVVELKGPHIPALVRRHRNHPIVGDEVHAAVSQAVNYLRGLDEMGATLRVAHEDAFGTSYDLVRVFATVVIGHPNHVTAYNARQVEQTIRTYNAHLNRVEVITYDTLLSAAERALNFEEMTVVPRPTTAQSGIDPRTSPSVPWDDEPPF